MPSKYHFASLEIMSVLKKNHLQNNKSAALILENGEILWGYGLGVQKAVVGEICFNTSQTGYQEALTDPSYTKQIITFTFLEFNFSSSLLSNIQPLFIIIPSGEKIFISLFSVFFEVKITFIFFFLNSFNNNQLPK